YMPGLLWLLVGVCTAGAVQDMLVLAASVRRGGKSLAEIARTELGRPAAVIVSAAILFIVVIALAGLGFVVVKALRGGEVWLAEDTRIVLPPQAKGLGEPETSSGRLVYHFPGGCRVHYPFGGPETERSEPFVLDVPADTPLRAERDTVALPAKSRELVPGS